ncbi:unnamed protein product, partial [Rotaria socialis]
NWPKKDIKRWFIDRIYNFFENHGKCYGGLGLHHLHLHLGDHLDRRGRRNAGDHLDRRGRRAGNYDAAYAAYFHLDRDGGYYGGYDYDHICLCD